MPNPDPAEGNEPGLPTRVAPNLNVGSFRFWFVGQRWEWSDEVARMHGYEPGSVVPTTELLLSHKHPDDRQHVQDQLDHLLHFGGSFSSRINMNLRENKGFTYGGRAGINEFTELRWMTIQTGHAHYPI